MNRRDQQFSGLGLLQFRTLVRRLNAVVDRVAHEVHQRLDQGINRSAVELGVVALELKINFLAELIREVAHEAWEPGKSSVDRHHAHAHDHVLDRLRSASQLADCGLQLQVVGFERELLNARAAHHQLTDHVQKRVQARGFNANGRAALRFLDGRIH